jgi:hypothetical protein
VTCVRGCRLLALLVVAATAGCVTAPGRDGPVQGRAFQLDDIAKSDIDMVAEVAVEEGLGQLRELTRKLYVRNPNQLRRGGHASLERALAKLFGPRSQPVIPSLGGRRAAEAIALAFEPAFDGDRVQAFAFGLRTMTIDAYGGKASFYLHDRLDPQKLYHLARNYEIAFWKLRHDRGPDGRRFLLSDDLSGDGDLSFARLSGKLIAVHDLMAQVVADSTNRQIKQVIQGVASAVFFPI